MCNQNTQRFVLNRDKTNYIFNVPLIMFIKKNPYNYLLYNFTKFIH